MALAPIIKKKDKPKIISNIKKAIQNADITEEDVDYKPSSGNFNHVLSTGSTLLDLGISGKRRRGGGVPSGILVELFGGPGTGKTAALASLCASAQAQGGEARFDDPEGRLDQEYSQIYRVNLATDFFDYHRSKLVSDLFQNMWDWKPKNPNVINIFAGDSMAALSTEMEMAEEDKRGQLRAKEFSAGFRKTCLLIAQQDRVIALSNQIRVGDGASYTTPGGFALPFYASLRIRFRFALQNAHVMEKIKFDLGKEKEVEETVGIKVDCWIAKSTVDEPYREVPLYITFGYGIDDIRANLQYVKDMTGATTYVIDGKSFRGMNQAIKHVEEHNKEKSLKENVIDIWEEIQRHRIVRKPRTII